MLRIRTMLFPTDFSPAADHALEVARSLARDHEARLILLHSVTSVPAAEVYIHETEMELLKSDARAQLQKLADRITDVPVEIHIPYGDPGHCIVAAAEELSADLIVMGTHGRGGLRRLLLGSVAEQVLRHAPCPVLAIKPGTEKHLQSEEV